MQTPMPQDPVRVAHLLAACEDLAEKLGIHVIRDRMGARGGLCQLKGQWRLYINVALDPEDQLETYASAFAGFDLSGQYVLPALRAEIERHGGE